MTPLTPLAVKSAKSIVKYVTIERFKIFLENTSVETESFKA